MSLSSFHTFRDVILTPRIPQISRGVSKGPDPYLASASSASIIGHEIVCLLQTTRDRRINVVSQTTTSLLSVDAGAGVHTYLRDSCVIHA